MGYSCGIDIVEVQRVQDNLTGSAADKFRELIYTSKECDICESRGVTRFQSYAGRFAAKEAFAKALGSGLTEQVRMDEIEVMQDENGKPFLVCHGITKETVREKGIREIEVSISHTAALATAVVILSK